MLGLSWKRRNGRICLVHRLTCGNLLGKDRLRGGLRDRTLLGKGERRDEQGDGKRGNTLHGNDLFSGRTDDSTGEWTAKPCQSPEKPCDMAHRIGVAGQV